MRARPATWALRATPSAGRCRAPTPGRCPALPPGRCRERPADPCRAPRPGPSRERGPGRFRQGPGRCRGRGRGRCRCPAATTADGGNWSLASERRLVRPDAARGQRSHAAGPPPVRCRAAAHRYPSPDHRLVRSRVRGQDRCHGPVPDRCRGPATGPQPWPTSGPDVRADAAGRDRAAAVADVLRPSVGADAADRDRSAALAGVRPGVRADAATGDGAHARRAGAGPA